MAEKFFGVEDIKVIGLTSTKNLIVSGVSTFQDVNIGTGGTVAVFDISSGKVGIGSTIPAYTLDLGESPSTIRLVSDHDGTAIRMGAGDQNHNFTMLRVDGSDGAHDGESDYGNYGFSLRYIGGLTGNDNKLRIVSDNQTGTAVNAFTMLQDGSVGINSINPRATLDVDGTLIVSGVSTLGVTTITDTTSQQLFVSGISTLGNVFIQPLDTGASVGEKEPGVSGVVTFYGDGSGLRNVVAIGTGIDVQNSGTAVGSASTVNFGDNLTGSLDAGVYTVNAADAPDPVFSSYSDYASHSETANYAYGIVGIGTTSYNEVGILTGTHTSNGDRYGQSVATSSDGKTIVVGAYYDNHPDSDSRSGVVYVYDRVGTTFTEVGILTGSYADDTDDKFGYSVATSADGKTIVVGAYYDNHPDSADESGLVYVFDRVGNNFNEVGILTGTHASDNGDRFGQAVATSADGKTIVVGAYDDEHPDNDDESGLVYVFDRVGNDFNEVSILTGTHATNNSDRFGQSVATSADGKTIVVGAYYDEHPDNSNDSGLVYVFDREYSVGIGTTFTEVGILTGTRASNGDDHFGWSVATSSDGKTIVVGALFDEGVGNEDNSGLVYVFDREYSVGIGTTFTEVGILTGTYASHGATSWDYFGISVATSADGNIIVVGAKGDETPATGPGSASGVVYVFNRQGNNFNEVGIITGSYADDIGDNFGYSVATSADGKTIVVGAPYDEGFDGDGSGLVYVFDQDVDANSLLSSTDGKNITVDARITANKGLSVSWPYSSTFGGNVVLSKTSSTPDFIIRRSYDELEYFTVKDGSVYIKEDLSVSGICTVGGDLSVADESKLRDLETHRGSDIKLNEALYITPDDSIQNWYIPVGYERQTSAQTGTAITANTLPADTTGYLRTTDAQVYNYCWDNYEAFDLDGDGVVSALDAIMFFKYYWGWEFHDASLISPYGSLLSSNATRTDYTSVIDYIIKYSSQKQTVSFSSGITTISGITTGTDVPKVRAGIAVTGPGIPADTTVVSIGVGEMTISNPTSGAESSVDLTFGNKAHGIFGRPDGTINYNEGTILARIFGLITQIPNPSPYSAVNYESYQFSNDEFLNPNDGGPPQFKRYQKVSIADTTSNAGGARYISTEAPSAGIGTEGDIWYDISSTGDSFGTNGNIPIGGIIMWYGSVANIPTSWRLCDGQSHSTAIGTIQTPDLRGQFVVGAADDSVEGTFSNNVGVGSTGGSADAVIVEHEHTAGTLAGSFNMWPTGSDGVYYEPRNVGGETSSSAGAFSVTISGSTGSVGVGSTNANLPPYYALAYIMRVV